MKFALLRNVFRFIWPCGQGQKPAQEEFPPKDESVASTSAQSLPTELTLLAEKLKESLEFEPITFVEPRFFTHMDFSGSTRGPKWHATHVESSFWVGTPEEYRTYLGYCEGQEAPKLFQAYLALLYTRDPKNRKEWICHVAYQVSSSPRGSDAELETRRGFYRAIHQELKKAGGSEFTYGQE